MNDSIKKTILLVEDEAIISLMEKQQLEDSGYTVYQAMTGEKAIDIVSSGGQQIDLILMDIDLGSGIDGTIAAAEILKTKDIPILFLSSHSEQEVVSKTEKITSYGYVVKNSNFTVLDASIKMAFKLFEARIKEKEKEKSLITERNQLLSIFNGIKESIYIADMNTYEVLFVNSTLKGILKRNPVGRICYQEFQGLDSPCPFCTNDILLKNPNHSYRWEYKNSNLNKTFSIHDQIIKWSDGRDVRLELAIDITEQKQAEESLKESEERFKALHNASFGGITIHDKGKILECNQGLSEITGYSIDELIGMDGLLLISDKTRDMVLNNILSGYERPYEAIGVRKNGEEYPVRLEARNIPYKGRMVRTVEFRDITEQKRAEDQLKLLSRLNSEMINLHDKKSIYDYIVSNLQRIYSDTIVAYVSIDDINEYTCLEAYSGIDNKILNMVFKKLGFNPVGKKYKLNSEHKLYFKDNGLVCFENGLSEFWKAEFSPVISDAIQTIVGIHKIYAIGVKKDDNLLAIIHFYTLKKQEIMDSAFIETFIKQAGVILQKKITEDKILELLKEKEIVLKESHHRIKNNMNAISGLLLLQASEQREQISVDILKDAANRIRSMIVLYDKLYRSDNPDSIYINEYLPILINQVVDILSKKTKIAVKTNIDAILLNSKLVSTLGIIINELVTNSIKYAFKDRDKGIISVDITKNKSIITIVFKDDGIGIPKSISFENSTGFGLNLVGMLVKQISGTISIKRNIGTKFVIEFEDF